ncbi:TetR family transcriptional regulator [Altererythrobacter salegens]|uniref:TetR family transcriptional regulator n=1 Tax=Croceibacterium salegens TaxID=1737568 RepID=A0A6I4T1S4_9SPHN|nr:TetR/AcrR family transcriptional regulator [Croceibacterium salegens]MXO61270.1 TetR family transcriptional regulator [Croceibacterium salegens]
MAGNFEPIASTAGGKQPRTERGRKTMRKLLDAAAAEFGEKGFHDGSISSITRRAGTALGTFYTYFDSKDEIFRALVGDLSAQVGARAAVALAGETAALEKERAALAAFLHFAQEHQEIYRIIDESEFVDPKGFRQHYETTASRILARLRQGSASGELRDDLGEAEAWAIMGMNVFLGLRFAVWSDGDKPEDIAAAASRLLSEGIAKK